MLLAFMAYLGHAQQHKPLKIWQGTPERAASVTLTPYIPQGAGRDCPAVIVCPGGSYHWLDTRTEGDGVARWLNSQGIAAFVLRYRVAGVLAFVTHYRLLIRGRRQPDMLRDVQRSVQLVREGASAWGINPTEVGVMGFSAGGHLAVASAAFATTNYLAPLGIKPKVSVRPDFVAALYPVVTLADERYVHRRSRKGILGEWKKTDNRLKDSLSVERKIPFDCPPVFLVHCDDDPIVHPGNSQLLDSALTSKGIPHQFVRYATGGHGFGASDVKGTKESRQWREAFVQWLKGTALPLARNNSKGKNDMYSGLTPSPSPRGEGSDMPCGLFAW